MSIPLFWLPLLFSHTTLVSPPDVPHQAKVVDAAHQFSKQVTRLSGAGWHLRDIGHDSTASGTRIALTLADGNSAQTLSLVYHASTDVFDQFLMEEAELPTEQRLYSTEAALFEELRFGAPNSIDVGCSELYWNFAGREVAMQASNFEVKLKESSNQPGRTLRAWLVTALENGELLDIRDQRYDDGASVRSEAIFVVESEEGIQEIRAMLDTDGAVISVALHHTPGLRSWRRHKNTAGFRAKLATEKSVTHIQIHSNGEFTFPRFDLKLASGAQLAIAENQFQEEAGECGC